MQNEENSKEQHQSEEANHIKNFKHEHYMNNLNVEQKHSMKDRFIVGFFLVVVTLPCIILGNYVFLALQLLLNSFFHLELEKYQLFHLQHRLIYI